MVNRRRVLVVDDDAGIRTMLSIALAEAGYDVRVTDGGGRVDAGDAELLVLDVRLGRRSAHDLLEQQPELAAIPAVVMTASASVVAAAFDPTRTILLRKPFDLDALEDALARLLAGPVSPQPPA